jgi:hypothetical protein
LESRIDLALRVAERCATETGEDDLAVVGDDDERWLVDEVLESVLTACEVLASSRVDDPALVLEVSALRGRRNVDVDADGENVGEGGRRGRRRRTVVVARRCLTSGDYGGGLETPSIAREMALLVATKGNDVLEVSTRSVVALMLLLTVTLTVSMSEEGRGVPTTDIGGTFLPTKFSTFRFGGDSSDDSLLVHGGRSVEDEGDRVPRRRERSLDEDEERSV